MAQVGQRIHAEPLANKRLVTLKTVLWALVGVLVSVSAVRFIHGLGAVTNLSDAAPWGLWIGFDVMSGVALAAGHVSGPEHADAVGAGLELAEGGHHHVVAAGATAGCRWGWTSRWTWRIRCMPILP